jgi:DNA invertase Pin-like site-specific DNA recombinase
MTYGYLRVSTNKQDVSSQKIGIEKKAAELELPIDEWIADEGVSGIKEYRERKLGSLINKVKEGDVLIVAEISRLARSMFMLFRIVERCVEKKNCIIHAVKENQVLKKDDKVSAIILFAYGIAAQIEREMIARRTKEGLERSRQKGVILGRPKIHYKEKYKDLMDYIKNNKGVNAKTLSCDFKMSLSSVYRIRGMI